MISIIFKEEPVPQGMKITQSYGIIFNNQGQILLKVENKKGKQVYSFAGGTPEDFDANIEQTLRRELVEEVNTTIKQDVYYVGFQLIDEHNHIPPYAQVRFTALIDTIGNKQPDPDNGETYDRLLTTPKNAIKLLNWGEVAKLQIEKAVEIAKQKFGITFNNNAPDMWV